jgi:hypothetical protein
VTEDSISAAGYVNGVLEVHVRKPEQPQPRKIEIDVGGGHKTIEGKSKQK